MPLVEIGIWKLPKTGLLALLPVAFFGQFCIEVRSRNGLVGIGTVEGVVTPGTLLRKVD